MLRLLDRGTDFRNGVEYGRILECIAIGKPVIGVEVDHRIRAENAELIKETCELAGYLADIDGPYPDGWCRFVAKKIKS